MMSGSVRLLVGIQRYELDPAILCHVVLRVLHEVYKPRRVRLRGIKLQ
jgi:hypothetical protein